MAREVGLGLELVFVLSLFIAVMFVLHLFIWQINSHIRFSYSYVKIVCVSFVISLAALSYFFVPHEDFDLTKHFQYMDDIRNSGKDFLELIKEAFTGQQHIGHYPTMLSYNILRDVLIILTDENSVLPLVTTFITYTIVVYITIDYLKKYKMHTRWLLISMVICFSSMPLLLVVSGIRNALAFSVVGLAFYLREEKKRSWWWFWGLCLIAVTVHISVAIAIIIYLMFVFLGKRLKKKYVLLGTLFVGFFAQILANSEITLLSDLAVRFLLYTEDYIYQGEKMKYISDIILVLILLYLTSRVSKEGEFGRWVHFFEIYSAFLLGTVFFGSTVFVTRYTYLLGVLAMPVTVGIICNALQQNRRNSQILQIILMAMCVLCGVNVLESMIYYVSCLI